MRRSAVFLALILACAGGFWLFRNNSLEDAFITFRYARHLAEGFGYGAWNLDGTRVDGSTSFLWTWWTAAGFKVGVPPLLWTALSSYAALVALFAILLFVVTPSPVAPGASASAQDPFDDVSRRRAAFLMAAYAPVHWYATSGMEAIAFMALGGIGLILAVTPGRAARIGFAASAVLLALLRPEGIVLIAGAVAVALASSDPRSRVSHVLPGVLAAIAAAFALAFYRRYMFGDWLPNTFYAKAAGFSLHRILLGAQYVWYFIQISQFWIAVILIAILARLATSWRLASWRSLTVLAVFLAGYAGYVVYAGGDEFSAFPFWRHFVHVFAFIALAVALAVGTVVPWQLGGTLLTVVLALVPNALILTLGPPADGGQGLRERIRQEASFEARQQEYFSWVGRLSKRSTIIATSLAGRFPYAVDATFIDMLALNDPYIAHHGTTDPQGPVDSRSDGAYVLGRSPDIIEGYMRASTIIAGDGKSIYRGRPKMVREIVSDPRFQAGYCFATIAPYRAMDRALFFKRDFASANGFTEAQCVPIRKTALALPERSAGPSPFAH